MASLDISILEREMLPALIERRFGAVSPGGTPPYLVSVTDVSGPAPRQVYPGPADAPGRTATTPTPAIRTVDVHVSSLRQKIEPTPGRPEFIVTVHELGYRFDG